MHITKRTLSSTKAELQLIAGAKEISDIKKLVVSELGRSIKVPGFREGRAPLNIVEKNIDGSTLQSHVLNDAVNRFVGEAMNAEKLRSVGRPNVTISKFVPYQELELKIETEIIGNIELPDYKKIKLAKPEVKVKTEDVNKVLDGLRTKEAVRIDVKRAARLGDEAIIDFEGTDIKTHDKINGGSAKNYPLLLGSGSFIPGFEDEIVGLKPNEQKEFVITFPKDYGLAALRNRKVSFKVKVSTLNELKQPPMDDKFAAKIGPFQTMQELRSDIKKSLIDEQNATIERDYQNKLIQKISDGTTVDIPQSLIDEESANIDRDERQNFAYRRMTFEQYLDSEGINEEQYKKLIKDNAIKRIKTALILTEIAEGEGLTVTDAEIDENIAFLKKTYDDPKMQSELDKPESRREIWSKLLSEKVLALITNSAS